MGEKQLADFGGYATRNDLVCSDGLTIKGGAFSHNNGKKIPLVWHHQGHENPENVLGHAILEERPDGIYAQGFFNNSPKALDAKEAVQHGDIDALSIFANQLRKSGVGRRDVVHGEIRELSLVLAGANPGAFIDSVSFSHSDGSAYSEDEAVVYTGFTLELSHADISGDDEDEKVADNLEHADNSTDNKEGGPTVADTQEKTVEEVFATLTPEQKEAVNIVVGASVPGAAPDADDDDIKHAAYGGYQEGFTHAMNVFQTQGDLKSKALGGGESLSHDNLRTLMLDGKALGSLKESHLKHADAYGITDIELLFPDARLAGDSPELIARQAEWVPKVLGATKKLPFAKVKSLTFDITAPEARAKGYVKGTRKTEEVLSLLKRETGPSTIYKKQKLDRDDILDITDFNVVVWLKWEIRFMLDEEIARAILVGDGRSNGNPDKVKDPAGDVNGIGIRSIRLDDDLYSIKKEIAANTSNKDLVKEITRSRIAYRGSGTPTLYTSDALLVELLLEEDGFGRRLYETETALASALRVKEIVAIELFNEYPDLLGIIVNLVDYSVGTNAGGDVKFFEDFDIDFNQEKYLMETRLSGALTKPFSAIVITRDAGVLTVASQPTFTPATNTIAIPTVTGLVYTIDGEEVTGNVVIVEDTTVEVSAESGYYIAPNATKSWTFSYAD